MATKKTFSNEYRNKAIEYVKEHPDIPISKAANNLNIAPSTLHKWIKASKENNGVVNMPGSGNSTTSREKELERVYFGNSLPGISAIVGHCQKGVSQ